ncbi:type 1 glutamine amidotransferase domain-containing protein [Aquihabitans sp. G128]|uniref:type 1 glutamine amidotransferase domain-containing protein n=1 Tax=Aquihabitans sp. G128 TaxID=2849779 RepID=UPI001C225C9A|nr:type 1 glutamine amidotransferase domain-containing protein [Aquihabitans sp. G128]QXC61128.1 type 1 glutamine amidotransferase domain-containing protein [Aquihabitans sp. G128]
MHVLVPLPDHDFDVTEVAVPWRLLTDAGHRVTFATESGAKPAGDPKLLAGVLFGQLGADPEPKAFYADLLDDPAFGAPERWADLDVAAYDGLILPGGHAPGMRQYLGSEVLQRQVAAFWALDRPVGAICHGVLVLARAVDPATGASVLAGRRTTCLTSWQERLAYYLTAWKLGRYYRTYPAYVEAEVRAALGPGGTFERGPLGSRRGTATDDDPAFVVVDGRYVSARWPGDAYLFTRRFLEVAGEA